MVDSNNIQTKIKIKISKKLKILLFFYFLATLCYCDEFCDRHINSDCCPDYQSFCLDMDVPDDLRIPTCHHNGVNFTQFDSPVMDNCNLW